MSWNNVIPGHMIGDFLRQNDLLPQRLDQYSIFDKRHVQAGIKMTEEDKMQRDYEDALTAVKLERAKVADRDTEIGELKKHIESNHEDLRAARKLRKQHEREIKLLRANVDLLEAEQELYLYDRDVDNAKDRQLLARTKVHNLRARYDELCDLRNNATS